MTVQDNRLAATARYLGTEQLDARHQRDLARLPDPELGVVKVLPGHDVAVVQKALRAAVGAPQTPQWR